MRDANLPGFDFLNPAPIALPIVVALIDFKLLQVQSSA
jgi:hypothetical protein